MSSLSCLHTSCRGYLIPGSTRLIVQYCKHVISRSTTSDDLFVDTTLMATQSLTEENSDLSENEDVQEIEDPILVAVNAGASLRSPTSAVIARKRKLPANEGKYKQRGSSKTTVRTSAWDRITEYPKHHFAVVNRKLRCNACREIISEKKRSIEKHIKSKKHERGLSEIAKSKSESQTITACLQRRDNRKKACGSTLPAEMRLFRFEVVESFLSGGIALAKVDALRPLLEKYGHRLTNRAHLSELIPAVLENEKDKLKKELKDVKEASVIFDGTARLGEALAVIVRYVQENFQPTQRLIRLDILAKALKGEELAQRLMSCLAVDYHFGPTAIIGGMRDGASVNGAALRELMFFYPKLFDVVCFSHTIDNVGNHFEFKILDLFARYWISMFSHSYNARLVWRERTGQSIRTFSETRWWSKWEVLRQVSEYFGDVEPFLRENDEVSPANRRRLLEIFDDPQSCQDLRLELAALVDAGVHFVNATYYLEGDGPLIFTCYERLSAVTRAVAVGNYPNTTAVAREIAGGNAVLCNQLMAQAKACIQPGFQFYHQKFSVQFHGTERAFKAARLCCPVQVQALNPTAASLEELRNFPFANDDATIANLAQELPLYLAASDGVTVTCEDDKLTWWANHKDTLPHWSSLVKKLLLIQPSSASAERVFSLLTNAFGSQQESALQDYLEASVMLRYNNAKRV